MATIYVTAVSATAIEVRWGGYDEDEDIFGLDADWFDLD